MQEKKGKASAPKEKKKGEAKQKEKQLNEEEVVAIESDVESDAEFVIDEQLESTTEQSAGTGPAVQSTSANPSATSVDADARTPMEVEEEAEVGMAMEISCLRRRIWR